MKELHSNNRDCESQKEDRQLLPVELWETIIDFCAYEARRASNMRLLHACALTCRAWLQRSRLHLYATIHLQNEDQLQHFLSLVRSNPEAGTFVRELNVGTLDRKSDRSLTGPGGANSGDKSSSRNTSGTHVEPSFNWICMVPLRLLPWLPSLQTVFFSKLPQFNSPTQKYLSLFQNFSNVQNLLCIRFASFASCRDLSRLVSLFPSVRRLYIEDVDIAIPTSSPPTFPYKPLKNGDLLAVLGLD
ncbi:hypothetical protein BXZ70DRAFT_909186 [Cristinia sonorae]|uniref:F-box domain-containing protein n=1 Tax=Cristinia sonorae TaxID=1940300 RepID=A0A8K0XMC5_9AGAR|nr:hypothetical protein BXZ70DRAFT_909186 [Cristinia sonorae]